MHSWALAVGMVPVLAAGMGGLWDRDEVLGAMDFPAERVAGQDERHVTAELVLEMDSIQPGSTAWLGVRFAIGSGWHMYWNGRNDTGLAPTFTPTLPAGYSLGGWVWPAPVRHVSPGDILDHVYTDSVLVMAPLTVPADAKAGEAASISMDVSWLVCDNERCVPEEGRVELKVPIAAKAQKGANARAFEAARLRVPKDWPTGSKEFTASIEKSKAGRVATIRIAGATRVEFYPHLDGADATGLLTGGISDGEALTLTVRGAGALRGVVGVARSGSRPTEFYTLSLGQVEVPAGGAAAGVREK